MPKDVRKTGRYPCGVREFIVHDINTRNEKTLNISGAELYITLSSNIFYVTKEIFFLIHNLLKTGPVIELEKSPVHGSLVRLVVEPWLN